MLAFDAIYWFESRGHRKADEHNGCVFNWVVNGTGKLVFGEQNPVLIDPMAAAFDPHALDATAAVVAAATLADPKAASL